MHRLIMRKETVLAMDDVDPELPAKRRHTGSLDDKVSGDEQFGQGLRGLNDLTQVGFGDHLPAAKVFRNSIPVELQPASVIGAGMDIRVRPK